MNKLIGTAITTAVGAGVVAFINANRPNTAIQVADSLDLRADSGTVSEDTRLIYGSAKIKRNLCGRSKQPITVAATTLGNSGLWKVKATFTNGVEYVMSNGDMDEVSNKMFDDLVKVSNVEGQWYIEQM